MNNRSIQIDFVEFYMFKVGNVYGYLGLQNLVFI
jgi:hypothetical protein